MKVYKNGTELAKAMGVDPAVIAKNFETYNAAA